MTNRTWRERVAHRLRKARLQARLKQNEAAAKVGVSNDALCRYEKGENAPPYDVLVKLADLYGVSLDYLLTGRKLPPQSVPWWERNDPPTEVELLDFIREGNVRLMGDPLDEQTKEELIVALRAIWEYRRAGRHGQNRRPVETSEEDGERTDD